MPTPLIQAVAIRGYKCFRDEQRLELRRLNLLYGENGAGKSALARLLPLLRASRGLDQAGLNLAAGVLRGAGFNDLKWRGEPAATAQPPEDLGALPSDIKIGLDLSSGTRWSWTFSWFDRVQDQVLSSIRIQDQARHCVREYIPERNVNARPFRYRGDSFDGPMKFGGILPVAGELRGFDLEIDALQTVLQGVRYVGSDRQGPPRGPTSVGAPRETTDDGTAKSVERFLLADIELQRRVSAWYERTAKRRIEVPQRGTDNQRITLAPIQVAAFGVPFADTGEGLQHVLPVLVELERLRSSGGFLVVEEPEAHLHPRLQAELAATVVDVLQSQPSAQILLETHSEVFLVAALEAAIGKTAFTALHWTETTAEGVGSVREIPIDRQGRPTTPRLELAFETMGTLRRRLIARRRGIDAI